ncbi:MAG TPA: histidine phosphatase family protein [Anaerolineales bacterium]|jgi:broad specificity phosphatase PhoE|nr:histidine phosphatase family protein [Anaerolineales bacterium]
MSTRVLLARHGDTAASKDGRFAGANDIPLSKEGRVHASELAVRLARYPLDGIYASSLQRAHDTAGFTASVHGLEVVPVHEFREMDHGVWNGKSLSEIAAQYGQAQLDEYNRDPFHFRPENGESGEDVLKRSAPKLSQLVEKHDGQTIFVVAHKTTNRLLICHFLGLNPGQYREKLAQRPACLNLLLFPNKDQAQLLLLNDIGHYAMSDSSQYEFVV